MVLILKRCVAVLPWVCTGCACGLRIFRSTWIGCADLKDVICPLCWLRDRMVIVRSVVFAAELGAGAGVRVYGHTADQLNCRVWQDLARC